MNIFVGCSSRDTNNESYLIATRKIGNFIAENGYNLVFGGWDKGLMGEVYHTVKQNPKSKSKVIVATCKKFINEFNNEKLYDEIYVYETMSDRKAKLIELADAIIILPGGLGSIDELITSVESKRFGDHNKPIIIVNANNFYDNIFKMIDRSCDEKFMDYESKKLFYVVSGADEAIEILNKELK